MSPASFHSPILVLPKSTLFILCVIATALSSLVIFLLQRFASCSILNNAMKHIRIRVIPKSGKEEVIEQDPLIVKVKEPPEKGAANKAAAKLLSRHFSKRVRIVSGGHRRQKIVELSD